MATSAKKAPVKAALKRAETSTKAATRAVKQAERTVSKPAARPTASAKKAPVAPSKKPAHPTSHSSAARKPVAPAKPAAKPLHAASVKIHVKATPAKAHPGLSRKEAQEIGRHVGQKTLRDVERKIERNAPSPVKNEPSAKVARPPVSVVKRQGPQLKSHVLVETRPVVPATSEKTAEVVTAQRPLVSATSHQLNHRALMRDLSGPAPAASPISQPAAAATSEKVATVPGSSAHAPAATQAQASRQADSAMAEAHQLLRTPAATPAPTAAPYKPQTTWRDQPHTGVQRNFELSTSGIANLASAAGTPGGAPATSSDRHVDGQPATSENTGAETRPAVWKTALAGNPGWPRSAVAGGTSMGSSARPSTQPASTGQAPGLIERRFEIYKEGLGGWRWRLVEASTGKLISVSQGQPFGTDTEAEQSAYNESRLYRPGTSLVTRL